MAPVEAAASLGTQCCHFPNRPTSTLSRLGLCMRVAIGRRRTTALRCLPEDDWPSKPAGASGEKAEGPQFAPLSDVVGESPEDAFGPLAVLLVGFQRHEVDAFKKMMVEDMGADMVKVISCWKDGLKATLQEVMESEPRPYEERPLGLRRAVIMSGMYGSEVMEVISACQDSQLPREMCFAVAVPRNWDHSVGELVDEIYDDDQYTKDMERQQLMDH